MTRPLQNMGVYTDMENRVYNELIGNGNIGFMDLCSYYRILEDEKRDMIKEVIDAVLMLQALDADLERSNRMVKRSGHSSQT